MRLFAITIFVSSFLLFQVQPMMGKLILPWFGGTPAVWTACLLFFQSALLGGYTYAHWLTERFAPARQATIHVGLLAISLLWLALAPLAAGLAGVGDSGVPALQVFAILTLVIGGPFLTLSATAPLLQSWFGLRHPGRSPYRLYALSNVGSLLGLFAYPFLIEWTLRLPVQRVAWWGGYAVFVAVCAATAWRMRTEPEPAQANAVGNDGARPTAKPGLRRIDAALWLILSACGSATLLAVTNQLCQNVASVPFLWVLPLGLYLVTFILCFDSDGWYRRGLFAVGWLVALVAGLWLLLGGSPPLMAQIAIYCGILFVCCMVCHGELAALRPEPRRLTRYFFLISTGGALGGVLVSLVAPAIFDGFYEFHVTLFGAGLLLILLYRRDHWLTLDGPERRRQVSRTAVAAAALAVCVAGAWGFARWTGALGGGADRIARDRNFYGLVSAQREPARDPRAATVSFTHGNTTHGFQFTDPARKAEPTGYYQKGSGVGLAIDRHPSRLAGRPLKIGLIGLGVGTLAAYGQAGDHLIFYEIDPQVERYARAYFTFLADAEARGATVETRIGDARLVLAAAGAEQFDVLVLDAFSSDAVPAHLLTDEAFAIYRTHLSAGGVLAAHVSNRHLDLTPLVRGAMERIGLTTGQIWRQSSDQSGLPEALDLHSHWIIGADRPDFLADATVAAALSPWDSETATLRWTDDFSSLFQVLR
ncbi:MAG: spermidine synthase [Verrucomicrobiales bacterium]|nr:spermidine synthase [Verrucomicrobiales bacterium]